MAMARMVKAMEEYEAYKLELQRSKTQFNQDMASLYAHMRHGGKVIDLWESMKLAGLNKDGDPKLAIVQADQAKVRFCKSRPSSGTFEFDRNNGRKSWGDWKIDVRIPDGFFSAWPEGISGTPPNQWKVLLRANVETTVPIVPAKIMNPLRSHKLENYHVLWEVEEWKPVPPKDPMLLKRITPNMFLILAAWDLTKLERAVIRGRL